MPTDADAVTRTPLGYVVADGVDAAGNFVTGDPRVGDAGRSPPSRSVAVADPTAFDGDPDLARARVGDVTLDHLELSTRFCDDDRLHGF